MQISKLTTATHPDFMLQPSVTAPPLGGDSDKPEPSKLLNVAITILSLAGVVVKEGGKKKYTPQNTSISPTTTIVASFSHNVATSQKAILTHVPSIPLHLPPSSSGKTFKDVVHWPDEDGECNKLSSFHFQRFFFYEAHGSNGKSGRSVDRFVPQSCPIYLAISRNGGMFKLGCANILVGGEENGESSINVPVVNCDQPIPNGLSRRSSGGNNKDPVISIMKVKRGNFQFGLDVNATLRVLVRVTEPEPSRKPMCEPSNLSPQLQPVNIPSSVTDTCPSEVSWEYDPRQAAVVLKRKEAQSEETRLCNQAAAVSARFTKNDVDVQSNSTATMTTEQNSMYESNSEQSQLLTSLSEDRQSHQSEQFSIYSQSGTEIALLISDILSSSRDKVTMSSTVASMRRGRTIGKRAENAVLIWNEMNKTSNRKSSETVASEDDSTVETSSNASSSMFSSIKNMQEKVFPHVSHGAKNWGRRFICGLPVCGAYNQDALSVVNDDIVFSMHKNNLRGQGCIQIHYNDSSDSEEDSSNGSSSVSDSESNL